MELDPQYLEVIFEHDDSVAQIEEAERDFSIKGILVKEWPCVDARLSVQCIDGDGESLILVPKQGYFYPLIPAVYKLKSIVKGFPLMSYWTNRLQLLPSHYREGYLMPDEGKHGAMKRVFYEEDLTAGGSSDSEFLAPATGLPWVRGYVPAAGGPYRVQFVLTHYTAGVKKVSLITMTIDTGTSSVGMTLGSLPVVEGDMLQLTITELTAAGPINIEAEVGVYA